MHLAPVRARKKLHSRMLPRVTLLFLHLVSLATYVPSPLLLYVPNACVRRHTNVSAHAPYILYSCNLPSSLCALSDMRS
ncbi:hypothetical protein BV20DRAFT_396512 [Pilatotrama ljubarskyi]|nr:hypothetical protein BV20DRAFT_396512 [Pilatotrama ljubarskyi]